MAPTFRPTTPADRSELVRFLSAAFRTREDAPFLEPRLMEWKYYLVRPGWTGSRSYVLEQNGRIVAHGCVYPTSIPGAIRVIDWAGSPAAPGSGVLLMRKLAAMAGTVLAPGGSADTRAVLPKIGFREVGRMYKYARVVRPWRHLLANPRRDWKTPARFVRNVMSSGTPRGRTAAPMKGAADARVDYMLACPGAKFEAYACEGGWFLVAYVLGQARIAAVKGPEAVWRAAVHTAAADPRTAEVMTAASEDGDAILAAGLRPRGSDVIYAFGKIDKVTLTLWDGDECFLANPADPFS